MSRARATQPPARPPAAESLPELAEFTPRNLMHLLMSKAAPQLSTADLLAIVKGGMDHADQAATQAARVAEGLGCLVADDAATGGQVGNFQDGESVASLVFHVATQFQHLASMAAAAGRAAEELASRGAA